MEKTSDKIQKQMSKSSNPNLDVKTVTEIIKNYEYNSIIIKIKENIKKITLFGFSQASAKENLITKSPNPRKTTGPDGIHIKVIKTAANVIDSHFPNIIK